MTFFSRASRSTKMPVSVRVCLRLKIQKENHFTQYTEKVFTLLCNVLPIFPTSSLSIHSITKDSLINWLEIMKNNTKYRYFISQYTQFTILLRTT